MRKLNGKSITSPTSPTELDVEYSSDRRIGRGRRLHVCIVGELTTTGPQSALLLLQLHK
jgi:hypothetical protein